MKKTLLMLFVLVVATGMLQAQSAEEIAMQEWMESISPNEHHTWLAQLEGEWTYTSSMWMDPSQPPTTGKGNSVKEMVMGGRYLEESHKGTSMGMPFEGKGVTAYDNAKGKYLTNWIDNFGTGFMTSEGQLEGDELITMSEYPNMTGGMDLIKSVTKIESKDKHIMTMYIVAKDGKEIKNMELIYTRK